MKLPHVPAEAVTRVQQGIREGTSIALFALAVYLLASLLSYHVNDPGWSHTGIHADVQNIGGRAGAWFADITFYLLGHMAFAIPPIAAYGAWLLFRDRKLDSGSYRVMAMLRWIGAIGLVLAGCGLTTILVATEPGQLPPGATSGGIVGAWIGGDLVSTFQMLGACLLLACLFMVSVTLYTGLSWFFVLDVIGGATLRVGEWLRLRAVDSGRGLGESVAVWREERETARAEAQRLQNVVKKAPARAAPRVGKAAADPAPAVSEPVLPALADDTDDGPVIAPAVPSGSGPKVSLAAAQSAPKIEKKAGPIKPSKRSLREKQGKLFGGQDTQVPPLDLLDAAAEQTVGYSDEALASMSQLLEEKFASYNVSIKVVAVHPGPVVTRFELQLASGVKSSQVSNLAKDIARSLSVISVRVVEVVPGKTTVGIEVPNTQREMVQLSEILQSDTYEQKESPLTMALGKDIAGRPVTADLARMPHLLVAGTTGSGKSVAVNVMLLSLLYKSSAKDVRLILIDPKMLELNIYEDIPHLLAPVVTDMKEAANALRWSVAEMERRYRVMAGLGVRNIAGYNKKIEEAEKRGETIPDPTWKPDPNGLDERTEAPALERLPYIVIVIDEFADMMMVVGKKVEELIARIAQKARAAGLHLILATQRPSVDVITGLIKANIPGRMAFRVSSKIDSRTILDQQGAEQLLGHGDMLYLPPGSSTLERVHGAFVDDHEVHAVCEYLKTHFEADYHEEILHESIALPGIPSDGGDGDLESEGDALYDQAVAVVTESRKASISYVQRRLKIGYNRAARMIEDMEAAGVVSPVGHNGQREVLAPPPVSS
ncbi:MAG: DNA translocase FtsK 4TM domain-containing protein [Pseudomonadota bacterium]